MSSALAARRGRFGTLFGHPVYLCDGAAIRNATDIEFTEGGNHERYPWIPEGEFWVEDTGDTTDMVACALHEYHESELMHAGEGYERAHAAASAMEREFRAGVGPASADFPEAEQWYAQNGQAHEVRKFEADLEVWLGALPLQKMAVKPEDLKPVAKYHDPSAHELVDYKPDLTAHPAANEYSASLFKRRVLDNPEVVKRGRTGTRESSNSTGKVVYDVEDPATEEPHRFMVKPYHEKVVPRVRSWMHHPIQGWAEMTNQALYHAAGIGHLHQDVHVAEVSLPGTRVRDWTPDERTKMLTQERGYGRTGFDEHELERQARWRWDGGVGPPEGPHKEPALVVKMDPDAETLARRRFLAPDEDLREQSKKICLMDFLTNNLDRHADNLLIVRDPETGQDDRLLAVDHSRSLQYKAPDKRGIGAFDPRRRSGPKLPPGVLMEDRLSNYAQDNAHSSLDPRVRNPTREQDEYHRHVEEWGPVFDWWDKNKDEVLKAFEARLHQIRDTSVREHVRRNFVARWEHLNRYARDGHENYGLSDWWDAPVPIYRYGTKDHEVET